MTERTYTAAERFELLRWAGDKPWVLEVIEALRRVYGQSTTAARVLAAIVVEQGK